MSILHAVLGGALRPVIRAMSQARRPQFEGKQVVEGLEAPVEVFRDSWSVPHIYASSPQDAFFAQGYVQAQDRLWQMEMNRRTGRGLLAQLFGEIALDTDRLIRTLGFNRLGQVDLDNLPDDLRHELDAYTAGVNACMEHIGNRLPIEFVLLGHRPEPWTPLDTMAFARVMIWQLSHAWVSEITRARLIEKVGDERAAELEIQYPERNPVTLPSGIQFNLIEPDGMLKAARGPFLNRGLEAGAGSNGWAIAACRSTTGHAVLCNDMHLALSAPSLWYTNHLSAGPEGADLHAAGVSLPGLPMVLVGHTARIAWGATLAFTDCEDLYIERLNPDDPHRYRFQDQWLEAELIPEVIPVKGRAEPHIEEVLMTRHGPLLDKALGYGTDELIDPETRKPLALAMQSMALRPCTAVQGWRLLNCAAGWDDFVEAVHLIEAPQLNLIYADVEDNIGHFVTGKVPVRAKGQGLVPAPGWTGDPVHNPSASLHVEAYRPGCQGALKKSLPRYSSVTEDKHNSYGI